MRQLTDRRNHCLKPCMYAYKYEYFFFLTTFCICSCFVYFCDAFKVIFFLNLNFCLLLSIEMASLAFTYCLICFVYFNFMRLWHSYICIFVYMYEYVCRYEYMHFCKHPKFLFIYCNKSLYVHTYVLAAAATFTQPTNSPSCLCRCSRLVDHSG